MAKSPANEHNYSKKPLGLGDALVGAVLFVLCVFGMQALLGAVVPGLLKPETAIHIIVSGLMFILCWALFGNYLFQPYLELFEEREARTEGDKQKAAEVKKGSLALQSEIEEHLREARLEGIRLRDVKVDDAKRSVDEILTAAQETSDGDMSRAQTKIAGMKEQAFREVSVESDKLAQQLVQTALATNPKQTVH